MGRKNSLAKNSIQMLCVMQHLDEQNLYERSKLLLSIYRNVCWTACDRAAMLREGAVYSMVPPRLIIPATLISSIGSMSSSSRPQ